jgi:hypothetical protein
MPDEPAAGWRDLIARPGRIGRSRPLTRKTLIRAARTRAKEIKVSPSEAVHEPGRSARTREKPAGA